MGSGASDVSYECSYSDTIWGRAGVEVQPYLEIYPAIGKNVGRRGKGVHRTKKGNYFKKCKTKGNEF